MARSVRSGGREATRRAVIYTRVSTAEQTTGGDAQALGLVQRCATEGWHVVAQVHDTASGRRSDRPGLARVLKLVEDGEVDVVLVFRLDRLARSLGHLIQIGRLCERKKVDLIASGQSVDTTTPHGRMMFAILGAFAELEADIARERTMAGLEAARARGVAIGGAANRFGLTPAEAVAAVAEHGSIRAAARALEVSAATIHRRVAEARESAAGGVS